MSEKSESGRFEDINRTIARELVERAGRLSAESAPPGDSPLPQYGLNLSMESRTALEGLIGVLRLREQPRTDFPEWLKESLLARIALMNPICKPLALRAYNFLTGEQRQVYASLRFFLERLE